MSSHRVFVDTGAWYAVQVADDEWHRDAVETLRGIVAGPHVLVTSNHVVGETYTLLRVTCGHAVAVRFLDQLDDSRRLERIFVQPDHEARAFRLLRQFADQDFSFVDACSFVAVGAHSARVCLRSEFRHRRVCSSSRRYAG